MPDALLTILGVMAVSLAVASMLAMSTLRRLNRQTLEQRFDNLDLRLQETRHSTAARLDRIDNLATSTRMLSTEVHEAVAKVQDVVKAIEHIDMDLDVVKKDLEVVRHHLQQVSAALEGTREASASTA